MTTFISFARRRNSDTTIDSICTRCYQTVARAHTPGDLDAYEQVHRCEQNEGFTGLQTGTRPSESGLSSKSEGGFSGFLSRLDSMQSTFRSKIAGQRQEERARSDEGEKADGTPVPPESISNGTPQGDSQ